MGCAYDGVADESMIMEGGDFLVLLLCRDTFFFLLEGTAKSQVRMDVCLYVGSMDEFILLF